MSNKTLQSANMKTKDKCNNTQWCHDQIPCFSSGKQLSLCFFHWVISGIYHICRPDGWFSSLICKSYSPQEQQVKQFVWYRFPMAWHAWLAPYTPFPHLTQIPVGNTSVSWVNYSVCKNKIRASYIQCGKEISWESLYTENYSSFFDSKAKHFVMCEHWFIPALRLSGCWAIRWIYCLLLECTVMIQTITGHAASFVGALLKSWSKNWLCQILSALL